MNVDQIIMDINERLAKVERALNNKIKRSKAVDHKTRNPFTVMVTCECGQSVGAGTTDIQWAGNGESCHTWMCPECGILTMVMLDQPGKEVYRASFHAERVGTQWSASAAWEALRGWLKEADANNVKPGFNNWNTVLAKMVELEESK